MATKNKTISLRPGESYVEAGTCIHTILERGLRDAQIQDDMRMGKSFRGYDLSAETLSAPEDRYLQVNLTFNEPRNIPGHTCPRCMQEIDPDVCGCGDYIEGHGNPMDTGHSPVPMGCDCFRSDRVLEEDFFAGSIRELQRAISDVFAHHAIDPRTWQIHDELQVTVQKDPVGRIRALTEMPLERVFGGLDKAGKRYTRDIATRYHPDYRRIDHRELGLSAVALAEGVGISAPKAAQPVYTDIGEDFEMSPEEIRAWRLKNG